MLRIYTDGSALSNGQSGAKAGVGVWFGDQDTRYPPPSPRPHPPTDPRPSTETFPSPSPAHGKQTNAPN